jgi:hypothetical protein
VEPVKAEVFFNKTYHDRFKIHLDSLQLNHFDFRRYQRFRVLNAASLHLDHGSLTITGNPRQSHQTTDRIKSFPHLALQQMQADISIDTIDAHRINISYTEYNQKSNKTGTVSFDNTQGIITNVTTDKDSLAKNHQCVARLRSDFMNTGKLDVTMALDLTDPNGAYTYKGSLGSMKLQAVNQATMPLALVKFNNGKLDHVDFDITANARTARGKLTALYTDLTVTVLKADTANDRLKHMTIASLFANSIVLKHDNPDEAGVAPRTAHINYYRPDSVAFFGSIWKTLLSGLKPSVGLDEQMQQNVKDRLAQQAANKEERKIKKAARQQRRAERKLRRELKKQQQQSATQ